MTCKPLVPPNSPCLIVLSYNRTLARYALVRLPDHLLSLPISRALMSLVTVTTKRQHAAVYAQATSLQNLVLKADYLDKDLVSMITALLTAFTGSSPLY